MQQPKQDQVRNKLLAAFPAHAFESIRPALEHVELEKGKVLVEAGLPFTTVTFPEMGLASVVNRSFNSRQLEVGVFGWDGMGSTAILLGSNQTPHAIFVQVPGRGYTMPANALRDLVDRDKEVQALLLRYVQAFLVQVAQTALSNGACTIEQRLARWLLMVHDRSNDDDLRLTHEFLSVMLGVRRTGVTLAMHMLEGARMIKARRGVVTILDRPKLIEMAADGYGLAESEYERLLGPSRRVDQAAN